jgi:hypothetical protein
MFKKRRSLEIGSKGSAPSRLQADIAFSQDGRALYCRLASYSQPHLPCFPRFNQEKWKAIASGAMPRACRPFQCPFSARIPIAELTEQLLN